MELLVKLIHSSIKLLRSTVYRNCLWGWVVVLWIPIILVHLIKPYDCKNTFNSIYLALGAAYVVTWYEVVVCFSVFVTAFLDVVYISRSVQVAPKMWKMPKLSVLYWDKKPLNAISCLLALQRVNFLGNMMAKMRKQPSLKSLFGYTISYYRLLFNLCICL